MSDTNSLDGLFHDAVGAIDSGDIETLERLIAEHPELLSDRLESPGAWLRERVGAALDDFFQSPYLLWFVAEDPVRNGVLPPNIAEVAQTIVRAARNAGVTSLQQQLDHALRLVSWSWIARDCGVQLVLIDVLVDAGADPGGNPDNALVNGNFAAARHLVERGAPLTLATALCLDRWDDAARLVPESTAATRQFGLVLAALNGKAEAVRRMIGAGIDVNAPSADLYSHASALHHAVCSGSLDTVRVLVDAGANLTARDSLWSGTPLGWAEYYLRDHARDARGREYLEIAGYLRDKGEVPIA